MTTEKVGVYDVMPLRVLEQIERLETAAIEKRNAGQVFLDEAEELYMEIDSIVESYRMRAEREGWDALRSEAERQDAISWYCDPLPGQGARV